MTNVPIKKMAAHVAGEANVSTRVATTVLAAAEKYLETYTTESLANGQSVPIFGLPGKNTIKVFGNTGTKSKTKLGPGPGWITLPNGQTLQFIPSKTLTKAVGRNP